MDVQVPAGIADGQALRIAGGRRGRALIFRIKVRPHSLYTVHGKDVQIELPAGSLGGGAGGEGGGADPGRDRWS